METPLPPSHEGSVVLDIGGDVGALVLHVPAELLGAEPEIAPLEGTGARIHSAVPAGRYRLCDTGEVFDVLGGNVTELRWTTAPEGPMSSSTSDRHHGHSHDHPDSGHS